MKNVLPLIVFCLSVLSCSKEKICTGTEQRIPGKIVRISGPDSLQMGKTVPLIVEVFAGDSLCIKSAEALILDTGTNYVQIGAELVHTGPKKDNSCECRDEQMVRTIIYFTPYMAGVYLVGIKVPVDIATNHPGDSTTYLAIVK